MRITDFGCACDLTVRVDKFATANKGEFENLLDAIFMQVPLIKV